MIPHIRYIVILLTIPILACGDSEQVRQSREGLAATIRQANLIFEDASKNPLKAISERQSYSTQLKELRFKLAGHTLGEDFQLLRKKLDSLLVTMENLYDVTASCSVNLVKLGRAADKFQSNKKKALDLSLDPTIRDVAETYYLSTLRYSKEFSNTKAEFAEDFKNYEELTRRGVELSETVNTMATSLAIRDSLKFTSLFAESSDAIAASWTLLNEMVLPLEELDATFRPLEHSRQATAQEFFEHRYKATLTGTQLNLIDCVVVERLKDHVVVRGVMPSGYRIFCYPQSLKDLEGVSKYKTIKVSGKYEGERSVNEFLMSGCSFSVGR